MRAGRPLGSQPETTNSKICLGCTESKLLTEFIKDKRNKSGRGPRCRSCEGTRQEVWRSANPERVNKALKKYRDNNKDKLHNLELVRNYGITLIQKQELFKRQLGKCAMPDCGLDLVSVFKANVDHNHTTGKLRSLLCGQCNRLLGYYETYDIRFISFDRYLRDND